MKIYIAVCVSLIQNKMFEFLNECIKEDLLLILQDCTKYQEELDHVKKENRGKILNFNLERLLIHSLCFIKT